MDASSALAGPAARPDLRVPACPRSQGKFDVPPPAPQTREQLQAEAHRAQTRIEDLERALAEQGQVGVAWATRGTWGTTGAGCPRLLSIPGPLRKWEELSAA